MLLAATRWEAAGPSYGSLRYVELAPQGPTWATDLIKSAGEPDVVLLPDLGGICSGRVLKFVLFTKPGEPGWASMPEVVRVLRLQLEAAGATVVDCGPRHCEVLPPGVHKGVGMLRLLEHLGVGADETLACGDGPNDVEMLQMAGVGAAVGNAGPEARAAADAVVASAEADGVADAVVRFALRQPAGAAQG
ncbi:unnamed protein product [Prorocentrum cordatum]|uniref:Phosphoglycolate phosphatase n=1 Tax=Prorocentrum cordatum TaxID=2364126 RepID=A0ABN9V858_9DINO|nr:unnamed protein product [Polarella glacialis]